MLIFKSPKSQGDDGDISSLDEESEGFLDNIKIIRQPCNLDFRVEESKVLLIPEYDNNSASSDDSPSKVKHVFLNDFHTSKSNKFIARFQDKNYAPYKTKLLKAGEYLNFKLITLIFF